MVFDWDRLSRNDFVGELYLPLDHLTEANPVMTGPTIRRPGGAGGVWELPFDPAHPPKSGFFPIQHAEYDKKQAGGGMLGSARPWHAQNNDMSAVRIFSSPQERKEAYRRGETHERGRLEVTLSVSWPSRKAASASTSSAASPSTPGKHAEGHGGGHGSPQATGHSKRGISAFPSESKRSESFGSAARTSKTTLYVTVGDATGLAAGDGFLSDPYVSIRPVGFGGRNPPVGMTAVRRRTLSPSWNETMSLDVGTDLLSKGLEVQIFHHGRHSADPVALLGSAIVPGNAIPARPHASGSRASAAPALRTFALREAPGLAATGASKVSLGLSWHAPQAHTLDGRRGSSEAHDDSYWYEMLAGGEYLRVMFTREGVVSGGFSTKRVWCRNSDAPFDSHDTLQWAESMTCARDLQAVCVDDIVSVSTAESGDNGGRSVNAANALNIVILGLGWRLELQASSAREQQKWTSAFNWMIAHRATRVASQRSRERRERAARLRRQYDERVSKNLTYHATHTTGPGAGASKLQVLRGDTVRLSVYPEQEQLAWLSHKLAHAWRTRLTECHARHEGSGTTFQSLAAPPSEATYEAYKSVAGALCYKIRSGEAANGSIMTAVVGPLAQQQHGASPQAAVDAASLVDKVEALAVYFRKHEIAHGSIVVLILPSGHELVATFLAANLVGATTLLLNLPSMAEAVAQNGPKLESRIDSLVAKLLGSAGRGKKACLVTTGQQAVDLATSSTASRSSRLRRIVAVGLTADQRIATRSDAAAVAAGAVPVDHWDDCVDPEFASKGNNPVVAEGAGRTASHGGLATLSAGGMLHVLDGQTLLESFLRFSVDAQPNPACGVSALFGEPAAQGAADDVALTSGDRCWDSHDTVLFVTRLTEPFTLIGGICGGLWRACRVVCLASVESSTSGGRAVRVAPEAHLRIASVLDVAARLGVTIMHAPPSLISSMSSKPSGFFDQFAGSKLRELVCHTGALDLHAAQGIGSIALAQCRKRLRLIRLRLVSGPWALCGATHISSGRCLGPSDPQPHLQPRGEKKDESVCILDCGDFQGRLMAGAECCIQDIFDTTSGALSANHGGQIMMRTVPPPTLSKSQDHFRPTGMYGHVDTEGGLVVVDPLDMRLAVPPLVDGSGTPHLTALFPRHLELCIASCTLVEDVVVCPLENPSEGTNEPVVYAFVLPQVGASLSRNDLDIFMSERLASWQWSSVGVHVIFPQARGRQACFLRPDNDKTVSSLSELRAQLRKDRSSVWFRNPSDPAHGVLGLPSARANWSARGDAAAESRHALAKHRLARTATSKGPASSVAGGEHSNAPLHKSLYQRTAQSAAALALSFAHNDSIATFQHEASAGWSECGSRKSAAGIGGAGYGETKQVATPQRSPSTQESPSTLVVTVHEARGLRIADKTSSDPYCKLSCGDDKAKTRVVKQNLNPVWGETFTLGVVRKLYTTTDVLLVDVWDHDKIGSHDKLGFVSIPLASILQEGGSIVRRAFPLLGGKEKTMFSKAKLATGDLVMSLVLHSGGESKYSAGSSSLGSTVSVIGGGGGGGGGGGDSMLYPQAVAESRVHAQDNSAQDFLSAVEAIGDAMDSLQKRGRAVEWLKSLDSVQKEDGLNVVLDLLSMPNAKMRQSLEKEGQRAAAGRDSSNTFLTEVFQFLIGVLRDLCRKTANGRCDAVHFDEYMHECARLSALRARGVADGHSEDIDAHPTNEALRITFLNLGVSLLILAGSLKLMPTTSRGLENLTLEYRAHSMRNPLAGGTGCASMSGVVTALCHAMDTNADIRAWYASADEELREHAEYLADVLGDDDGQGPNNVPQTLLQGLRGLTGLDRAAAAAAPEAVAVATDRAMWKTAQGQFGTWPEILPMPVRACMNQRTRRDVLFVTIVRANGLRAADKASALANRSASSDPFAVLRLGNRRVESTIKYKTVDPYWNETFEFSEADMKGSSGALSIELLDKDGIGSKNDPLGMVTVPITGLAKGKVEQQTINVEGRGGQGQLMVEFRLSDRHSEQQREAQSLAAVYKFRIIAARNMSGGAERSTALQVQINGAVQQDRTRKLDVLAAGGAPRWDHTFTVPGKRLTGRHVTFKLIDAKRGMKELGQATMDVDTAATGKERWLILTDSKTMRQRHGELCIEFERTVDETAAGLAAAAGGGGSGESKAAGRAGNASAGGGGSGSAAEPMFPFIWNAQWPHDVVFHNRTGEAVDLFYYQTDATPVREAGTDRWEASRHVGLPTVVAKVTAWGTGVVTPAMLAGNVDLSCPEHGNLFCLRAAPSADVLGRRKLILEMERAYHGRLVQEAAGDAVVTEFEGHAHSNLDNGLTDPHHFEYDPESGERVPFRSLRIDYSTLGAATVEWPVYEFNQTSSVFRLATATLRSLYHSKEAELNDARFGNNEW